jgi:hypothetical protein
LYYFLFYYYYLFILIYRGEDHTVQQAQKAVLLGRKKVLDENSIEAAKRKQDQAQASRE